MGLDKFSDDSSFSKAYEKEEKEQIKIPKNTYKSKVDNRVNKALDKKLNLLNIGQEAANKKIGMSFYFHKEDLQLLKAIAYYSNTTVNKIVATILREPLRVTKTNLPDCFDIDEYAELYDSKSCSKYKTEDDNNNTEE